MGGGNGFVAKALQDSGLDVVLIEPGFAGSANAKRRGVNHVVCSTLQDAGFHANVLPAIGLFDVLEHIEHDQVFLGDIWKYLIPGGRVYLSVPAWPQLWSYEDVDAGHRRRYTIQEICESIRSCGFEIEYATYFFGFLVLPIFLFRRLPFSLGITGKKSFAERAPRDHHIKSPLIGSIMGQLANRELKRIRARVRMRFGASCLVVAKKPGS